MALEPQCPSFVMQRHAAVSLAVPSGGGGYKGAIQISEGMGTIQPSSLKAPGCPPSVPPKHFAWGTVYLYLSYEIAGKQKGFLCTFWYWRIEPDGGLWSECRSAPKGHRLGLPGNHILLTTQTSLVRGGSGARWKHRETSNRL